MNTPQHKPIKRSPYLAPLSREHHEGLLLAWKIKQGVSKCVDSSRIVLYINWFYKEMLQPHFKTEEETFGKILPPDDLMLLQMFQEHRSIGKALKELTNKTIHSDAELLDFGTLIQLHIRFEERILFNRIESILSPIELAQLDTDSKHTAEVWRDPFWL